MFLLLDLSIAEVVGGRDVPNTPLLAAAATAVGRGIPRQPLDSVTSRNFVTSLHYWRPPLLPLSAAAADPLTAATAPAAVLTQTTGGNTHIEITSNLTPARGVYQEKAHTL